MYLLYMIFIFIIITIIIVNIIIVKKKRLLEHLAIKICDKTFLKCF